MLETRFKNHEEITTKNLLTIQDHTNETRRIVREIESKVQHLEAIISQKDQEIAQIRAQLVAIQQKVYSGGT